MEQSEQINELAAALVKAKANMRPAFKTALNPAFARGGSAGSKYAKLEDCDAAASPALCENGLVLIQGVHGDAFIARLIHVSGQWIQIRVPLPGDVHSMTVQQLGSMTTYLRRQTFSLVGLVTDDDDDGNAASKPKTMAEDGTFKDGSGKPDTTEIDKDKAIEYAEGMMRIRDADDPKRAIELHDELIGYDDDKAMYTAAMDAYKLLCKGDGVTYAHDKWSALVKRGRQA